MKLAMLSAAPPVLTIPQSRNSHAPLSLRLAQEDDAPAIVDYYLRNRAYLAPTDPPMPEGFYTESFWKERIDKSKLEFQLDVSARFFLFAANHERILASISFTQISRGPLQACYLGYSLDEQEQGKGLMTQSLAVAIDYMFKEKNLHRIMANHLPENDKSARVLKRLGFEAEGLAKQYLFINGAWRDHVLNSRINPNWRTS
jgi:ribosomal-protein-alanine N-acetyltransferase